MSARQGWRNVNRCVIILWAHFNVTAEMDTLSMLMDGPVMVSSTTFILSIIICSEELFPSTIIIITLTIQDGKNDIMFSDGLVVYHFIAYIVSSCSSSSCCSSCSLLLLLHMMLIMLFLLLFLLLLLLLFLLLL